MRVRVCMCVVCGVWYVVCISISMDVVGTERFILLHVSNLADSTCAVLRDTNERNRAVGLWHGNFLQPSTLQSCSIYLLLRYLGISVDCLCLFAQPNVGSSRIARQSAELYYLRSKCQTVVLSPQRSRC